MIGGVNSVSTSLAYIYNTNNRTLSQTLERIASGKKINTPSDDFVGYARATALQSSISDYETIKEELTEARGVAEMAAELGNGVYEDLLRMKELAELYNDASATTDEQTAYDAEFQALADSMVETITNNKYDSNAVVSANTIIEVGIDPTTAANKLSVAFVAGDIIDTANIPNWTLSAGANQKTSTDVQTEIDKATSYLVKAEGYVSKIDRQINITDTMINSKEATKSLITDIDEVEEMNAATTLQIRQQAAIAMMAQANMSQQGILRLYT